MSYDAGKLVGGDDWIGLHKNENHFISSEWIERVINNFETGRNKKRPGLVVKTRATSTRRQWPHSPNSYRG